MFICWLWLSYFPITNINFSSFPISNLSLSHVRILIIYFLKSMIHEFPWFYFLPNLLAQFYAIMTIDWCYYSLSSDGNCYHSHMVKIITTSLYLEFQEVIRFDMCESELQVQEPCQLIQKNNLFLRFLNSKYIWFVCLYVCVCVCVCFHWTSLFLYVYINIFQSIIFVYSLEDFHIYVLYGL